ncbi:MAG: metallophosphoesterase [Candidatus Poribacteria bacterium]|nr:metallophosphoesterase [Candidatus Poribacteria bacterium]
MPKSAHLLKIVVLPALYLAIIATVTAQTPKFPERTPIIERPFSDDPDKFSFAIIGDKTGGGLDKWPVFDRAIDEINILKPDFAIMVGDLIQGGTRDLEQLAAEWKEFWQHESDLIVPFLPLPGNHDITNPVMYDYWKEHLGRTYSAFTYKNCLFIMLNTEEWHNSRHAEWDWEKEGWFGEAQIKYVEDELAQHPNVRHTFVLMHRPIWLYENSGWEHVEAALNDRAYTVFAGHYHNLTLHTRNDRRYFVLSATGGGLTPQEAPEAGAFDHYSIVTVDDEEVNVAIIEPGNVHPADISTAAIKEKIANLLTFNSHFNIDRTQPFSSGKLEIALENTLEKQLEVEIVFHPNQNWQISPHRLSFQVKPGQLTKGTVGLTVASDALTPLPTYDYSIVYGGEQLTGRKNLFHPIDRSNMHVLKDWMLLGPFDLGVTEVPTNANDIPSDFIAVSLPESGVDKTYEGQSGEVVWQKHLSETERINLDSAFGNPDWAFGYGTTHIKSPNAQRVFAQIGWGCHLGRLFLNGVEVPEASVPGALLFRGWAHFELSLKAGWNTLTIQSGDYTGGWDYRMEIANSTNTLQFSMTPVDLQNQ